VTLTKSSADRREAAVTTDQGSHKSQDQLYEVDSKEDTGDGGGERG
jgi:hypothetical protein